MVCIFTNFSKSKTLYRKCINTSHLGPVTNLRKHINTTNENQHRDARQQLSEMETKQLI